MALKCDERLLPSKTFFPFNNSLTQFFNLSLFRILTTETSVLPLWFHSDLTTIVWYRVYTHVYSHTSRISWLFYTHKKKPEWNETSRKTFSLNFNYLFTITKLALLVNPKYDWKKSVRLGLFSGLIRPECWLFVIPCSPLPNTPL